MHAIIVDVSISDVEQAQRELRERIGARDRDGRPRALQRARDGNRRERQRPRGRRARLDPHPLARRGTRRRGIGNGLLRRPPSVKWHRFAARLRWRSCPAAHAEARRLRR